MKSILLGIAGVLLLSGVHGQYYYKDLLVPAQASMQLEKYKDRKVRSVKLSSYESDGQPTEKFSGDQEVNSAYTSITTNLESALAGASRLISTFNSAGLLLMTSDTTDGAGSTTQYTYDRNNQPSRVVNESVSAGGNKQSEEHVWTFANGKPSQMLLIRNNVDTTFIKFVLDEKGNVVEENATRNGATQPSYYYYYDDLKHLTDIVTYNIKAKRLLPAYVFEYNEDGSPHSMMVVPEGSSDYQKWYYEYTNGLKSKETVFNKKKQLLGRIEYHYD